MAVRAEAKSKRWAKRVERFHEILRDQSLGAGLYLGKQGINPATLAEELAEQLKAMKQQVFCYKGDLVLSDPMVDWQTRGRALELAIKLWSMMPPERRRVRGEASSVRGEGAGEGRKAEAKKNGLDQETLKKVREQIYGVA